MKISKRQLRRIIKEEKQKILKEFFDFSAADEDMIPHAKAMGRLLAGRPDVAIMIRDALSGQAPFPKAGEALYKAFEASQASADSEWALTAGYDD